MPAPVRPPNASTLIVLAAITFSGCAYDFDAAFDEAPLNYGNADASADVSQDVMEEGGEGSDAADGNQLPDRIDSAPDQQTDGPDDAPFDVPDDGSDDVTPDVQDTGADACPPLTKPCGGSCVPLDDPATGCATSSCLPCTPAHANVTCGPLGECAVASCHAGFGDCNGDPQDGCETSLSFDRSNCGSCGHSCCGGSCAAGNCTPGALVPGSVNVPAMANDATSVYWLDELGTLRRVHKNETTATTVCTVDPDGAVDPGDDGALVLDDQFAYFGFADGAVYRVAKNATNAQPDILAFPNSENGAILDMTLDGDELFYTVRSTLHIPGTARRMLTDGSSNYSVMMSGDEDPRAIAVSATHVFYLQYLSRTLTARLRTSATATDLVNFGRLSDLVVDGSQLYYANPSAELVGRIDTSLSTGSIEALYEDPDTTPARITVDATHVYFTDAGKTPAVARVSKLTQAFEVVATSQGVPRAITDDATCVFWATDGSGPVQGARK